jgi:hypothetical protein
VPTAVAPIPQNYIDAIFRLTEEELLDEYGVRGNSRRLIRQNGKISGRTLDKLNPYFKNIGLPPLEWERLGLVQEIATSSTPPPVQAHSSNSSHALSRLAPTNLVANDPPRPSDGVSWVDLAGKGHPGPAMEILLTDFSRLLGTSANEALLCLRDAIYVGNRYLSPTV